GFKRLDARVQSTGRCRGGDRLRAAPRRGGARGGRERLRESRAPAMTALLSRPPPVESLVPHRDPALLVPVVVSSSPGEVVCNAVVWGEHPLAVQGRVPCLLGFEAAAQAAAALEALARSPEEPPSPRLGYLVGVREAAFHLPDLPAGWPLRVAVRAAGSAPP